MPRLTAADFENFNPNWTPDCQGFLDRATAIPPRGVDLPTVANFLGESVCGRGKKGCPELGKCAIRNDLIGIEASAKQAQAGLVERMPSPSTMKPSPVTFKPSNLSVYPS